MAQVDDFRYMTQAVQLAQRGLYTTDPNPRVGCLLVKDEKVIGRGWHQRTGEAHAEIIALDEAGDTAQGATAYVTLEPCCHKGKTPPCSDALIKAGIKRVVVAMEDPNPQVSGKGISQLRDSGITIELGVMKEQAEKINLGFVQRMRHGRPYVRCKMAMSMDGRTAMASGESQWITGEQARQDVQKLRARSSVIVTGINTVLADDPSMTSRYEDEEILQPVRVILDSNLRIPANAQILSLAGRKIICTTSEAIIDSEDKQEKIKVTGAEIVPLEKENQRVSLTDFMAYLERENFNEVLLESGSELSGAFLQAGMIDEMIIYIAPMLMGNTAKGLLALPGITEMSDVYNLEITDIRAVGKDWRVVALPKNTISSSKFKNSK